MSFSLRDATPNDAAAIAAIYRHYVETSIVTFEEIAPNEAEIASRMAVVLKVGLPWLVAEEERRVVAYAYARPFHPRPGYRFTVENAIYVARTHARRGLGVALTREVIARCTAQGYRQMVAMIAGDRDGPSARMHATLGFRHVGFLSSLGFKFGRWIDVVEMQLALGDGDATIPR